ncbi:MAG: hypothetical protein HRT57_06120 [Crocinitomicaceae bacterium]|nr:hypothetical protein [Crocinitomicaceae bacterium]
MEFTIAKTKSTDDIDFINEAIFSNYIDQGLIHSQATDPMIFYPQFNQLENTNIYIIRNKVNKMIGSISSTRDLGDLPLPKEYDSAINKLRKEKYTVFGVWRFYVDPKYKQTALSLHLIARVMGDVRKAPWPSRVAILSVFEEMVKKYVFVTVGELIADIKTRKNSIFKDNTWYLIMVKSDQLDNSPLRRLF